MSLYNAEPLRSEAFRLTVANWSDRTGPIVCGSCGCRLQPVPGRAGSQVAWRHFPGIGGCDARGCRVECVDHDHRADGSPLI